jgi:hypothetical protein
MSDTKLVRAATLDWFRAVVEDIEGVHLRPCTSTASRGWRRWQEQTSLCCSPAWPQTNWAI